MIHAVPNAEEDASQPDRIRVSEIFGPTIQGEGALIGLPTVFVRTGGCDYRCSWCDSLHAVDPAYRADWHPMTPVAVMDRVAELSGGQPLMITLSGGNPAIQPFARLIELGRARGFGFAMETQGSVVKPWFGELDMLVLSPKPPSSGMETDWAALERSVMAGRNGRGDTQIILKLVVFDETDYAFARDVAARFPDLPLYLQPGNHTPPPADQADAPIDIDGIEDRMRWLVDRVAQDHWYAPRVLPQLHVMLWGNKRGV